MRRQFAEVDDNGVVVEIHSSDVKSNKGDNAKEPKTPINKRKASHKVMPSTAANKGDKWSDKHGCFLRPLPKR